MSDCKHGQPDWAACPKCIEDSAENMGERIAELEAEIERLKSAHRWIPVTESLPDYEIGKEYLWFQPESKGRQPEYGRRARCVVSSAKPGPRETTHWMPLPEPPNGVEE